MFFLDGFDVLGPWLPHHRVIATANLKHRIRKFYNTNFNWICSNRMMTWRCMLSLGGWRERFVDLVMWMENSQQENLHEYYCNWTGTMNVQWVFRLYPINIRSKISLFSMPAGQWFFTQKYSIFFFGCIFIFRCIFFLFPFFH